MLTPAAEELLMRGALFAQALRRLGGPGAVLVTAAIFAGVHAVSFNLTQPLSLVPLALALGWLAGRRIGARIAEYWSRDAEHGPLFSGRICDVIRHGVATLLLGIILSAWLWHPLAALGLG
ncbi:CPBP family glutamic-type intramembrane protease, partial [Proteus mirabilis]|uniref:CPBP family glutamic-type intramembrane protease n=1 Tax=Proteus mirabilis TaxID=584 RepID=UPI0023B779D2